ncbi:MAG: hypothetical protein NC485_03620 [Ruminococcus flavefaciens]|nr:hypothetical protein [Ruminococcus flavefaciens]MCM1059542.1 hypothetical protein [Eubacterium sp.]
MNGYRKSKGIVIELTALLDVILIMLFWVMMNVQENGESAMADAERRTAAVQQQLEDTQNELDRLIEKNAELMKKWNAAENLNKDAAANQEALIGYEQGKLITLDIEYDTDGKLYVYNSDECLGSVSLDSETEISGCIIDSLGKAGLEEDDVILCVLIYDGSTSLYKDIKTVNAAVDVVRAEYKNFYCAYINTAERKDLN